MRRPIERLGLAAFDLLVGLWPRDQRAEFGPGMREMFTRRLGGAGGTMATAVVLVRELTSLAAQGVRARLATPRAGAGMLAFDARLALRSIVRRPRHALLVFATLTVGLGLSVSAYAVFESTLVRALPFPDGDRLVGLTTTRGGTPTAFGEMSWLDVMDLRASTTTLAALGAHTMPSEAALGGGDRPALTSVVEVTPGYFETFGIAPERGRLFTDADHAAPDVALVAHATWVSRFGADPEVVGTVVSLDERPVRIVGVLPPVARFYPAPDVGFWLPYAPEGQSRGSRNLVAVGRLRGDLDPDRGPAAAIREMRAVMAGLAEAFPDSNAELSVQLDPLAARMAGPDLPRVLALLLGATVAVLLLAGANVAGLTLARAHERIPDLAVLASLGAPRARLVRPVLLESLFLAAAGGVAAVALARQVPAFVLARAPLDVPRSGEVGLDARVLGFAALGTLLVTGLAAVVPAWSASRRALRERTQSGRTLARRGLSVREGLTVAQVAGTLALLTAAGLTLRSLERLTSVDPGFDAARVATVGVRLERGTYPRAADVFAFQDAVIAAALRIPGAERAAAVSMVPFGGDRLCDLLAVDGSEPLPDCVQFRSVTPRYFATLGIPFVEGRDIVREDDADAPRVTVLSRSTARTAFPDGQALGRTIDARGERWTVVGVVEDSRLATLSDEAPPVAYLPFKQAPFRLMTAVVRGRDAAALAAALPDAVHAVDPALPVRDAVTLARRVSGSAAAHRFRGAIFGGAGVIALFLAGLGLAGSLLDHVQRHRREIGVRMALGSGRGAVVAAVLLRALRSAGLGVLLGLGGALLVGRLLAGFLFGVGEVDLPSLLGATAALTLAAVVAAAVPAAHAASVDPVRTLRGE